MNTSESLHHYGENKVIHASPTDVFSYIDDPSKFSSYMNESSLMLGGGKMSTVVDEKKGQAVGSHIKMDGIVFGIRIFLDEVVTKREPPTLKVWETVGIPKLLIIGQYQMTVEVTPQAENSLLSVSIDYELPLTNAWLGQLFSGLYAKWCVEQMISGTADHFNSHAEEHITFIRSDKRLDYSNN